MAGRASALPSPGRARHLYAGLQPDQLRRRFLLDKPRLSPAMIVRAPYSQPREIVNTRTGAYAGSGRSSELRTAAPGEIGAATSFYEHGLLMPMVPREMSLSR